MLDNKRVLVVSPNQLQGLGLRSILMDVFDAEEVVLTDHFDGTFRHRYVDYIFLPSDLYLAHEKACHSLRHRIIILTDFEPRERLDASPPMLNVMWSQGDLVDRLKQILQRTSARAAQRRDEGLTDREIDVLKLVARGFLNKQIAEKLSISLHTVISHRKNITRKLGIRTVPGLTAFALLHGLISVATIE